MNLGALLCDLQRSNEALDIYETALAQCGECASLNFNYAIVLEDLGQLHLALQQYKKCLEIEPTLADAHFNVGRLQEIRGDKQAALRHFSEYRRLQNDLGE